MEVPQVVALVIVALSMIYFLKHAVALARFGMTEYSGSADLLRRSLAPMARAACVAAAAAAYFAFPGMPAKAISYANQYVPADTLALAVQFSPMVALLVGVLYMFKILRSA